jgi:Uma2 family endonuclease
LLKRRRDAALCNRELTEVSLRQKESMRIEAEKKLFTSDDINKMYEAGILGPDDRVELLDGEIILMNPGRKHTACTDRANALFTEALGRRAIVSIQGPIVIDIHNEPKPDVLVLKPRTDFYASFDRTIEHALLVIEISDTTLDRDLRRKLPHYAASGVPDFWVEDLQHDLILVFREPEGNGYKEHLTFGRDDAISPLAFPDVVFTVADLLG